MSEETSRAARRQLPIPAVQPAKKPAKEHANTAAALAHNLAQRIIQIRDDDPNEGEQIARIFIHTIVSMPGEHLADLVKEPASTGAPPLGCVSPGSRRVALPDGRAQDSDTRLGKDNPPGRGLGPVRWVDPRRRLVHAFGALDAGRVPAPRDRARPQ